MATPIGASAFVAALRKEGLRVVEVGSWRTHNRNHKGPWGPVHGVMIHHTVTSGSARTVEICRTGYSTLPGPLCHGVITKDGRVHLVGHGRANHAGMGDDDVLRAVIAERSLPPDNEANTDGNRHFYGFECENLGDGRDPWPAAQLDAIERAAAALCRHHGWKAESVIGHLEWQPGKVDPRGFSMNTMRARVRERLNHNPGWDWGEEDDVPKVIGEYQTSDIRLAPRQWKTLDIKGTDILTGATRYQVMAHLTAALPAGSTIQGRFYHLRPDGTRWESGIIERVGTPGNTYADFHHSGSIARGEKLRFEAAYYPADPNDDAPVTIVTSRLRGLYWD
ncbi:N-acetylmuramoyl-L-alanine amidase [Streptomyces radiopugnans]|uniref:N-acetylmuramoyl-L-alanine amidase n=1 Tax=Streptomyces radiopugnans TaxID=403935 RepID=A0A1H8YX71_9ACTN|nr:N-acetylmuramoyl-L-alanine amidase [Streptomyces radiopugnans]SEP56712.1 N-acetylmuramoyl-L-alanine amidase [Streptomyces radiopugnans]